MEAERTGFHTIEEPHPTKLVEGGVCITKFPDIEMTGD